MILEALNSLNGNTHYITRYFNFIERCKAQVNEGYTEGHHILPRSLFKEYEREDWNMVRLSARQHFIAHIMLAKAYGGGMWHALNMMTHCDESGKRDYRVASKLYSTLKTERSKVLSDAWSGENNPRYGSSRSGELNPMYGKKHSEETLAKQSAVKIEYFADYDNRLIGEKNGMYGKTHSAEFKQRKSESMSGENHHYFGKTRPLESIAKQSAAMKGRPQTDEHRAKVSAALKGKPKTNGAKLSETRKDLRRVNTLASFIWVHKDLLGDYFFRDGKYYNYDV